MKLSARAMAMAPARRRTGMGPALQIVAKTSHGWAVRMDQMIPDGQMVVSCPDHSAIVDPKVGFFMFPPVIGQYWTWAWDSMAIIQQDAAKV